jgi:hypothetical protein
MKDIDIVLVRYCPNPKDAEVFERVRGMVAGIPGAKLWERDNTKDNIGLVAARNELAAKGCAELICFMDFDFSSMEVDWEALREKALEAGVGIVFPSEGSKMGEDWCQPVRVPCNVLLMRREVFDRLEGFDDRYFVAYADWDLIMKARMEDLRTVQHNRSTVRHIGLSNANPKKQQMWSKDRSVFRSTWGVERLI